MYKIELQKNINNLLCYFQDNGTDMEDAIARVKKISGANTLTNDVVALPDFHYKVGNFIPTGTVTATDKTRIMPCAVGNGSGCGYHFINLNLKKSDISDKQIDRLFQEFLAHIDIKPASGKFDDAFYLKAFKHGLDAIEDIDDNDKKRFDYKGNIFNDHPFIDANVNYEKLMPPKNYRRIFSDLEVLGGGNHFIELLSVKNIPNNDIAAHFNLEKESLLINFHADANAVGNMAESFTPYKTFKNWERIKREFKKMKFHLRFYKHLLNYVKQDEIFTLKTNSKTGQNFLSFVLAAANYGAVNRYLLSQKIMEIFADVFQPSRKPQIIADTVHDLISLENDLWIHRTGATRVTPNDAFSSPEYKKYGKPFATPIALGSPTIFGVAGNGVQNTYASLPHGAGRVLDRSKSIHFSINDIEQVMSENEVKLYSYGSFDLTREHPAAFRKFENIYESLSENHLLEIGAILEPLAILKA
jgi:tRNA-splicing ligase RtcB